MIAFDPSLCSDRYMMKYLHDIYGLTYATALKMVFRGQVIWFQSTSPLNASLCLRDGLVVALSLTKPSIFWPYLSGNEELKMITRMMSGEFYYWSIINYLSHIQLSVTRMTTKSSSWEELKLSIWERQLPTNYKN